MDAALAVAVAGQIMQADQGGGGPLEGVAALLRGFGGVGGPAAENGVELGAGHEPRSAGGQRARGQAQTDVDGQEARDAAHQFQHGGRAAHFFLSGLEQQTDAAAQRRA